MKTQLRVLYVASLWQGSSCVPRMRGLQKCGVEVTCLDTSRLYSSKSRVVNSLTHRTSLTPSAIALNKTLQSIALQIRPDLVWVDKGTWIYPFVLRWLKKRKCILVHYNTDDVFAPGPEFWLHRLGIPSYDLYLTTNRHNVSEVAGRYQVRAIRAGMGYDGEILERAQPLNDANCLASYLFFGGHWEFHTESYVRALTDAGMEVRVVGHNWHKAKEPALRTITPLPYEAYLNATAAAPMAICFLSHRNRNDSTIRSFEIPALGSALLAERTGEHEYIYGDGVGAALFSNQNEAIAKAAYYLTHHRERAQIAEEGRRRCLMLRMTWEDHIQREWRILAREVFRESGCTGGEDSPFWPGYRRGVDWGGTVS